MFLMRQKRQMQDALERLQRRSDNASEHAALKNDLSVPHSRSHDKHQLWYCAVICIPASIVLGYGALLKEALRIYMYHSSIIFAPAPVIYIRSRASLALFVVHT